MTEHYAIDLFRPGTAVSAIVDQAFLPATQVDSATDVPPSGCDYGYFAFYFRPATNIRDNADASRGTVPSLRRIAASSLSCSSYS